MAIIADPYIEESNEESTSDISRDSFLPEQLPEASFELEPTGSVPPRTIQNRTQTALEQGFPRKRFSQFDYPSDSDSEPAVTETPIPDLASQVEFPELHDLEPLFSDQEEIQPEALTRGLIPSPSGTSTPLLSNPSLTDTLSNFPLFNPNDPRPLAQTEQPQGTNAEHKNKNPEPPPFPLQPGSASGIGRPRGRPPGCKNQRTTSSSRSTTSSRKPTMRPRRGPRTRFSTRGPTGTHDRAMTLPEISVNQALTQSGSRENTSTQEPRYQLRANRAPRYKCGTCGSRNCSCVHQITTEPPDLRLARGATIPTCELALARTPEHPQYGVLAVRAQRQKLITPPTIRHIIITAEKTNASTESGVVPPLESTLKAMHDSSPSDCPTYRFKRASKGHIMSAVDWNSH